MADELNDLEKKVLKQGTVEWKREVTRVKEAILILYSPFMGTELTPEQYTLITYRTIQLLESLSVPPGIDEAALAGVMEAYKIGLKVARQGSDVDSLPPTEVSKDSIRAVTGMRERAQDAVRQAKDNLSDPAAVSTFEGLLGAIKPVVESPQKMEMATTFAMNNAKNQAIADVAKETGESLTFVSERDACIHCTRYAGEVAGPNGFPKGLTFGKKPLEGKGHFSAPPLHPNCRCDVEIGLSPEYRQALKREAVRSVLRGTKMPSESERVRVEAAARLLEKDPVAPASVKKYSKKMIEEFEKDHPKRKKTSNK